MRSALVAIAMAASGVLIGRAQAAPVLSYQVYDGGTELGTGTATAGTLSGTASDAHFSVGVNAIGAPAVTAPNFSNNSFTVASDGTAGTVTVDITDYGLTSPITNVLDSFTTNSVAGGGFKSDTITNYYDDTNAPFGTEFTLGSATYSGLSSFSSGPTPGVLSPTGPYSETTVYTLTFGSGTSGASVSASSQIVAALPEPAGIAMIGVGLAVVGLLRPRRTAVSA